MNIQKHLIKRFNKKETLLILSSFPERKKEVSRDNAIGRYTKLLLDNYPKNRKIVVICEKRKNEKPYLLNKNILVVPNYKTNSFSFFADVIRVLVNFRSARDFLVQFEFSVFGGKIMIPQVLFVLGFSKLIGKNLVVMLHQVVKNLSELSGHLGIRKNGLKTSMLNLLLKMFYVFIGQFSNKILVHDKALADHLSEQVNGEKISVIPHGIGKRKTFSKKERNIARKKIGLKRDDFVLLVYGYRSWYKGTDWIIKTITKFNKENPSNEVKLIIAGGDSPTLKTTSAYKTFKNELTGLIKKINGNFVVTGFVPEAEVGGLFAATDLVLFPYRTKMSASGAFSLTLRYGKPFLTSINFMKQKEFELSNVSFSLHYGSFEKTLLGYFKDNNAKSKIKEISSKIANACSWKKTSMLYEFEMVGSRLGVNEAIITPEYATSKV